MSSWKKTLNRQIDLKINPITDYQIGQTALLTAVPFFSALLLFVMLFIFSKLNLYFLEANGAVDDPQVREAYFQEVQIAIFRASGYFALLLTATAALSYVVTSWAVAPFRAAEKLLRHNKEHPGTIIQNSRFLSEIPGMDRIFREFALGTLKKPNAGEETYIPGKSYVFMAKYLAIFIFLSTITGYSLGIILSSTYEEIVSLGLRLIPSARHIGYYFSEQEDILNKATLILSVAALAIYIYIGIRMLRYMTVMCMIFCRAVQENRHPLRLRGDDIYHGLAAIVNEIVASRR